MDAMEKARSIKCWNCKKTFADMVISEGLLVSDYESEANHVIQGEMDWCCSNYCFNRMHTLQDQLGTCPECEDDTHKCECGN